MTEENTYCTGIFNKDFTHCSPKIYYSDFDEHRTMKDIAERIVSDMRFDEQCRKNYEARQRMV